MMKIFAIDLGKAVRWARTRTDYHIEAVAGVVQIEEQTNGSVILTNLEENRILRIPASNIAFIEYLAEEPSKNDKPTGSSERASEPTGKRTRGK